MGVPSSTGCVPDRPLSNTVVVRLDAARGCCVIFAVVSPLTWDGRAVLHCLLFSFAAGWLLPGPVSFRVWSQPRNELPQTPVAFADLPFAFSRTLSLHLHTLRPLPNTVFIFKLLWTWQDCSLTVPFFFAKHRLRTSLLCRPLQQRGCRLIALVQNLVHATYRIRYPPPASSYQT